MPPSFFFDPRRPAALRASDAGQSSEAEVTHAEPAAPEVKAANATAEEHLCDELGMAGDELVISTNNDDVRAA